MPVSPAGPDLLLLESTLFWSKYRLPIIAACAVLALALLGTEYYRIHQEKTLRLASAQLDAAKTPAEYQSVITQFPHTPAAANAFLLLGDSQVQAKKYQDAMNTFRDFAEQYPKHSLAPAALIGAAGAAESAGKPDVARSLYERVASTYPASYAAPLARLNEAGMLKGERKLDEARRIYENIIAANPDSDAAHQATDELRFIHVLPTPGQAPLKYMKLDSAMPSPPSLLALPQATPASVAPVAK